MRPLWTLAALAACTPTNELDPVAGKEWPILSAFFTLAPDTFDSDDLVTITLSSLPDACERDGVWRAGASAAETPEDLADAWLAAFPSAFFEVDVVARVQGGTWPPKGSLWSGLAWDALPESNNVVFAVLTEHVTLRDEDFWAQEYDDEDDYEHVFYSDGGLAKWKKVIPGSRLAGGFVTDVVDGGGTYAGTTEIRFDATICGN